jgi:molybdenum cofactor cytidylyltransferase
MMVRAPSFVGVILAAGESRRMGSDKALLPWRGRTFLEAAIASLQPVTDMVLVVAGKNAEALRPLVDAVGASLIVNPAPERDQFSSLQVGLQEVLNRGRDTAFLTLVDRPAAEGATLQQLRQAYLESESRVWAVVPEYAGRHGHPIVFGREMISALLHEPVESNARAVEHAHREHILYLAVDDPLVAENIDTPEEFQRIAE